MKKFRSPKNLNLKKLDQQKFSPQKKLNLKKIGPRKIR